MRQCTVVAVLVVQLAGCSLFLVDKVPEQWEPTVSPDCTSTYGWVTGDAIATGISGFVGGPYLMSSALASSCEPGESPCMRKLGLYVGIPFVATAVALGVATYIGFKRVSTCNDAQREHLAWRSKQNRLARERLNREPTTPTSDVPAGSVLPRTPTKKDLRRAMSSVAQQVGNCGRKHKGAKVEVSLTVSPAGEVSSAVASPANKLGKCVAAVVRRATFPETTAGGTFSYPFEFSR